MLSALQTAALLGRKLPPILCLSGALILAACQTPFGTIPDDQSEQNAQTSDAGEAEKKTENDETKGQPSFSQFSDIPIPEGANMDLDQTLILGNQDGWIGRLSLKSSHSMAKMYNFYEREMSRFGWNQITVVRTSISTMTYSRGQRIATITLQPGALAGGVTINFTVAPTNNPQN